MEREKKRLIRIKQLDEREAPWFWGWEVIEREGTIASGFSTLMSGRALATDLMERFRSVRVSIERFRKVVVQ